LRWTNLVPSWVVLAMIILAASGVCCTVIVRSRAEFKTSSSQYQGMTSEIDSMRQANQSLQMEINRLTNDSHAIELAARQRLGMVRPNDVVVPIESISSSTSLGTLSFVR
jgi:cell division protein FtsL